MIPTKKLFSVLKEKNIKLVFADLPQEVGGYYGKEGSIKIIIINEELRHNVKEMRSTLARQLGYACTDYKKNKKTWKIVEIRRVGIIY